MTGTTRNIWRGFVERLARCNRSLSVGRCSVAGKTMIDKRWLKHSLLATLLIVLAVAPVLMSTPAEAQTDTAILQGSVTDPTGAVIPDTQIKITNAATEVVRTARTDSNGNFTAVGLKPGTYSLRIEHAGFKAAEIKNIVLSVGAREQLPIHLALGTANETVTVNGSAIPLLTTSPSVSTVVNQQEVANMPLNGQSFQDLMLMVPGVTTASPQSGEPSGSNGVSLISVNGDTGFSNSFTVDGVSANFGANNNGGYVGTGGSGGLAAATVQGLTQALVPVDDLQEFRVETNSYAAEYGGYSGGQFVFVTRSGTNKFHGSASDYLRNTVFDANDYFDNYYNTPRQPFRQNDFSGTLGGPVWIPHLYDGKDKTFFFVNYEGLRANLPTAAYLQYVPTAAMKAAATGPIAAFLDSFPASNILSGPDSDFGDGLAGYTSGYSALNNLNTYNLRFDEDLSKTEQLFVRGSNTTSNATEYYLASREILQQNTRMYTAGLTSEFGRSVTNELRANFSSNSGTQQGAPNVQDGSSPYDLIAAAGYPDDIPHIAVYIDLYPATGTLGQTQYRGVNETRQFNITDSLTWILGAHQLKFGVNYRKLNSTQLPESPSTGFDYSSEATLLANQPDYIYNDSTGLFYPGVRNFAAFAEDEWRVSHRLSLSYGIRWDLMPPQTLRRGYMPYTLLNQNNLSALTLGPSGPAYDTTYYNFAPRLGATYLAHTRPGYETQIRGGIGLFYDSAVNQGNALIGVYSPGFSGDNSFCPYSYCNYDAQYSFPLPAQYLYTPIQNPPVPPFTSTFDAISPHFTNPYTIQLNVALQQDFGANNALTFNYVGAFYRKGIEWTSVYEYPYNPEFQFVEFESNGLRSAYNAGDVVFQHRASHGLYAYASYNWAHDITMNQINDYTPYEKGNAAGDVRSNFNAVLTWDIPYSPINRAMRAVLGHWGTDLRFMARTGFPVTLYGVSTPDPAANGSYVSPGLNFVPNEPIYLYGTSNNGEKIPGGKQLNPAAFTEAPIGVNGNVPLNYFRGFGMNQWNVSLRRDFRIYDGPVLQFRVGAFNVFNHPNFGAIDDYLPDYTFGQATNSLATSLSPSGGTSSSYQSGGPRNLQLGLKMQF
jgi:hypothetical protein